MLITTATELPRLIACNGSRLMFRSLPLQASDPTDREEGNAAHWAAQQIFTGNPITSGTLAPNGHTVTAEMLEHVELYLTAIGMGEMECETSFGTDEYRVNARADHREWRDGNRHLFINDFKYGWRLIEPRDNWTLIAHAIGTVQFAAVLPERITFGIHQPRPHHPDGKSRYWTITAAELQQLWQQLDATLRAPSDLLQTSPQCATCHALPTCPAARKASMNAIDATALPFSDDLPNETVGYELDTLRAASATLNNRLEALEELAKHRLRAGQIIEPYALDNRYGNYRWKAGLTPLALTAASGIDMSVPSLPTPAEARRRGMPEPVIKSLTERPLTGVKLVRQSADDRARKLLNKEGN